jgi:single-strand DNA-binding protein
MAYSLNKVQIIGNCGKDPEVRSLNSGDKVANLRIATTERWNDKASNTQKEATEWHNVVVFGRLSEIIEKYVNKGSKLYVEGKLVTRKWQDNNGNDKYTTEIQVNNFNGQVILLDSKGGGQSAQPSQQGGGHPQQAKPQQNNQQNNNTGFQTDFSNPF